MASPTTISDDNGTPLSSFSTASSVDHHVPKRGRSNHQSNEYSTEDFREKYCHRIFVSINYRKFLITPVKSDHVLRNK